jgi:DNA-binding IclR family transcriptional regulator
MQSTHKALELLKHVGTRHDTGLRLTDLVELTGYDKSTVHRQLRALVQQGFVEVAPASRRYRLGIEAMQLGFAAADMAPLVERFGPVLHRVARISEDTVFLVVRSGDHAVFVHRLAGAHPVRTFVSEAGTRRLLGISAVGVCILAQESDAAVASLHRRQARRYEQQGLTAGMLLDMVRFARRNGYSTMRDIGPVNTSGVGCAVRISSTMMTGVSIAAVTDRMRADRMKSLGELLVSELSAMAWKPPAP